MEKIRILSVCLGNICRSPAVEFLLKDYIKKTCPDKSPHIIIKSAGLEAWSGGGMYHLTEKYLVSKGINTNSFRSKNIEEYDLEKFDLIIVMEEYMKKEISYLVKDGNSNVKNGPRIFTLPELVGKSGDIIDPYGFSRKEYFKIMSEIDKMCSIMAKKICNNGLF